MKTEDLSKLPKWAQEHIRDLQRQRDTAVRELNEWSDDQTPSAFRIQELVCTGEQSGPSTKTRYIQTHRITVTHGNIELDVSLPISNSGPGIVLQWGHKDRSTIDVAMIPQSYQRVSLIEKSEMR